MSDTPIATTGGAVLTGVKEIVAILEASIPTIAGLSNPISAGLSAASVLLTVADKLVKSGLMTVDDQLALQKRVADIVSGSVFSAPQWQPRPESPDYTKPS